jgi:iron(III) transport system ATP-binding protein
MLAVNRLVKLYGRADDASVGGVRGVTFDIAAGEFYTLLGPSGCGKTTALRSVAGLEVPSSGVIEIDGQPVFDDARRISVPASERGLGMVFQSYAVWPHMSVRENVAFPLQMSKARIGRQEIARRVDRILSTVGLDSYAERSAHQLSGGQQQRLSLARALVSEPKLLLLDEPLSNLDALLRDQMRVELRRLQKDAGVATLYVTHDQSEALALSDRIAVMNNGAIEQIGPPRKSTRGLATISSHHSSVESTCLKRAPVH